MDYSLSNPKTHKSGEGMAGLPLILLLPLIP